MMLYLKKIALLLVVLIVTENTLASNSNTVTGRYLSVVNKPSHEQQDLLSQTIQILFPHTVKTISDAVNHLLRYSGYSLIAEDQRNPALKNTLQKPLPLVDRSFGPMTLRDALTTLIGPAFSLSEDALNREVSFNLKSNFSKKVSHGVK